MLSAGLLGAALAAAYAGPLRIDIFGIGLSIRSLSRPLMATAVMLALRLWLLRSVATASTTLAAMARVASGALIAAGLLGWITYNSPTLGGADSYGYVSAAERLLQGDLVQEEPFVAILPFPDAIRASTPLGYVPAGRSANATVPAYPLGLPAVMATGIAIFGSSAPFFVAPVCGLVLLSAAYLIVLAWYRDRQMALLACALLALHPVVFTYSIQPMSDVPATAAIIGAVALLSRTPSKPLLAGLAAALAVTIRPALAPAAFVLASIPLAIMGRRGMRAAIRYLFPVVMGVVLQGWTQWYLYGNAFSSGYGSVAALFSSATLNMNLRSYLYWGVFALGPVWVAGLAVGLATSHRTPLITVALLGISVAAPYLFYRPYDHWETLRFLLPALVLATIVASSGLLYVSRRVAGHSGGALIAALLAIFVAYSWASWLSANNVFSMAEHEARHRIVGERVARVTPPNAVVLALQHSGSVRYYANRHTLNWNDIPSGQLTPTVRGLQQRGIPVFLLIDSEEERALFQSRHGRAMENEGWLPGGQYRNVQLFEAPPERVR